MILNEIQVILLLVMFACAIYLSYRRGNETGYTEGYQDACVDVAHGNITVSLQPPKEDI